MTATEDDFSHALVAADALWDAVKPVRATTPPYLLHRKDLRDLSEAIARYYLELGRHEGWNKGYDDSEDDRRYPSTNPFPKPGAPKEVN